MGFKKTLSNIFKGEWPRRKLHKYRIRNELKRIYNQPRFIAGYAYIFDRPFKYHDNLSFLHTYQELFLNKIYQFHSTPGKTVILDCGANMGLSVLYFATNYPNHKIIAFEPEKQVFNILKENVETFQLKNVKLLNQAVWDKSEYLNFYTDHGMGGRVNLEYTDQQAELIEAVPLADFLSTEVDFLKVDIEGAENIVLKSCKGRLAEVNNIFFEYHNIIHSSQTLDELLKLVREEGFKYYIKESAIRGRPFIDADLICEQFDMAINIFCYKV